MPTNNLCQRTIMAAAIAACFPGLASAAPVARVDFAVGPVSAVGTDGRTRTLTKGSEIEVGDTVKTQAGRAQLRFADGAYMSLQPQTDFKVEEFKYSGKEDPSDNIVMNLLRGGMRTITGAIGRTNRANYKMRTEVATIGIRGTEYSVKYTNSIEVYCANGTITVQNEGGTLTLNGGQGGFVGNNNAQPQRTSDKPDLPPQQPSEKKEEPPIAPPSNPFVPPVENLLTGTHEPASWAAATEGSSPVSRAMERITLDSAGKLLSFTDSLEFTTNVGTATAISAGNDGIIAWGRWVGGSSAGDGTFSNRNLASDPLHYVVGVAPTNLPTTGDGVAYNQIGFSASCNGSCTGMTVASALTMNFGSGFANVSMTLGIGGMGTYTGQETLGLNRANGLLTNQGSMFLSNGAGGSGSLTMNGMLAGPAGSRAGIAFQGSVNTAQQQFSEIWGVTAYKKAGSP
jgi:hypothetical protein